MYVDVSRRGLCTFVDRDRSLQLLAERALEVELAAEDGWDDNQGHEDRVSQDKQQTVADDNASSLFPLSKREDRRVNLPAGSQPEQRGRV